MFFLARGRIGPKFFFFPSGFAYNKHTLS